MNKWIPVRWLSAVLLTMWLSGPLSAGELGKATFAVGCFDVGSAALEGRPGVIKVEKGRQDSEEVDRVTYDPEKTSVPEMESLLREAGTYRKTLSP